MNYTPNEICSLIKKLMRIEDLPLNCSFSDAGFSNSDLLKIQSGLAKRYHKTAARIDYSDTTYTLTDKMNGTTKSN